MSIGVREAKARLSHYIDKARESGSVTITQRGKPVARLVGIHFGPASKAARDVLGGLVGAGVVDAGEGKRTSTPARTVVPPVGISVTALVRRMRT